MTVLTRNQNLFANEIFENGGSGNNGDYSGRSTSLGD